MNSLTVKKNHSLHTPYKKPEPSRFGYRHPEVRTQQNEIHYILRSAGAQAKLTIGQPNDKYEQEADRVADRVMRMPDADVAQSTDPGSAQPMRIHDRCTECDGLHLQTRAQSVDTPEVSCGIESRINSLNSGGHELDYSTRAFFEPRFGHEFSQVRLHTNDEAADIAKSINARAFTLGNHVVMGAGEYQPRSQSGKRLLGHELAHTVQQTGVGGLQNYTPTIQRKPEETYWFQTGAPKKAIKTGASLEFEPKGVPHVDPALYTIEDKEMGKLTVRFAGLDTDFHNERPKSEMKKGESLIMDAIKEAMEDMTGLPEIKGAASMKEARAMRRKDKIIRARLKEVYRGLTGKTLNIFIATELSVSEKMSLRPLTFRTEEIFISAKDYGDTKKLQAAVRVPLVALIGGEVGIQMGGEKGMEEVSRKALSPEHTKTAMLHEMLHVYLINQGASANKIWSNVGHSMVNGPAEVKAQLDAVMRLYLLAQEEVFVYRNIGEMYSEFAENREHYENFIEAVNIFLASKSVISNQVKTINLPVKEKVGKKKVTWSISFNYPKSVTVTNSDMSLVKDLIDLY